MDTAHFEPRVEAYEHLMKLGFQLTASKGLDFNIGRRLLPLFHNTGFVGLNISEHQPAFLRGAGKQSIEMTALEVMPHLICQGLATREEIEQQLSALREAVLDETVLLRVARMTQVWGRAAR